MDNMSILIKERKTGKITGILKMLLELNKNYQEDLTKLNSTEDKTNVIANSMLDTKEMEVNTENVMKMDSLTNISQDSKTKKS